MSLQGLIIGGIAVAAMVALLVHMRLQMRRQIPSQDPKELQTFLAGCVSELRQLLERSDLDVTSLDREASAVLEKMQSRNSGGALDAFIQDNRDAVQQAISRRRAA